MEKSIYEDFTREELEDFAQNLFIKCGYYYTLIQKCPSCKAKLKKELGGE